MSRLIDAEALKEHKFVGNKYVQIGGRTNSKTLRTVNQAYQQGWNDAIDAIIANAPTVEALTYTDIIEANKEGYNTARRLYERPQGEWVVQRLQNGFDDVYCPLCNARPTKSDYGYYLKDKFCHECGADLREQTSK